MDLTPAMELAVLLFFGLAGGLYLVGRGKSILLQYNAVKARIAERESLGEDSQD